MDDPKQKFIDDLGEIMREKGPALTECVADAFVVCEAADRNRVEAINFLESQCGEDRGAFIGKLAGIVESASGSERDYALRGLETYANIVLPAKE